MKTMCFFALLLVCATIHAQEQPGVNCHPIQGQGWNGCVPNYQNQQGSQQPQARPSRQGLWVDMWGAIVTDNAKNVLGASVQKQTEAQAWQAAEEDCHAKGGVNCEHVGDYVNQCIAVVSGLTGSGVGLGITQEDAIKKALKNCSKKFSSCETSYAACSLPIVIP